MDVPKWASVGNKVKFKYNVTWDCEGTIASVSTEGGYPKLTMKEVTINGEPHKSYTFHLPSIKSPSLI